MHDLHGIPLGRVCEQMGLGPGSVVEVFHRLARLFGGIPDRLVSDMLALERAGTMQTTDAARLLPDYLSAVEQLARTVDGWHA